MKKIIFKLLKFLTKVFSGTGISKIPGVLPMREFIYKLSKPRGITRISCQGHKMYINAEDVGIVPFLLRNGVHEPFETELLRNLLVKDATVINIGANIGYYSLIAANGVGPNGKVYAFEPEPSNYKLLVKNIEENGYKNIIPVEAAVSDKQETLKFFLDKSNLGAHSLAEKNTIEKSGFIEIKTDSLDNFFKEYGQNFKVNLIQIDAQGSEGLILDGAKKILRNNKLKIIMEFWPYGLKNMGTDALVLLKKIENYGFKIRFIHETNKCISSLPSEKIVEMCINSKNGRGFTNLLLEN